MPRVLWGWLWLLAIADGLSVARVKIVTTAVPTPTSAVEFPPSLTLPQRLGRSLRFYSQVLPILAKYKLKEVELERRCASDDECAVEYGELDEWGSSRLRDTILELEGFYVKSGQVLSTRVDLFPKAYTDKLQILQDGLAPMDPRLVREVVRTELLRGAPLEEVFASFDDAPLGCASIAQVHAATLLDGRKVAVKVQRPNCEPKLNGDVENLKRFTKLLAAQLPIDYYTVFTELGEVLQYELDFLHEAQATEKIAASLEPNPPLYVPRPIPGLASRRVLVLEFVDGVPLSRLAEAAAERGIAPGSPESKILGRKIVTALADAYAIMIFDAGFVHGDPHPGNIFVRPGGNVALIDCGQVKQLSLATRATIGGLVALVSEYEVEPSFATIEAIAQGVRQFGVELQPRDAEDRAAAREDSATDDANSATDDANCLAAIALLLFGERGATLPGGYSADELSDRSPIRRLSSFPPEFVLLGRAAVLIKGIAAKLEVPFSLARRWEPKARLAAARDASSPDALPKWMMTRSTGAALTESRRAPDNAPTLADVRTSLATTAKLSANWGLAKIAKILPAGLTRRATTLGARLALKFQKDQL